MEQRWRSWISQIKMKFFFQIWHKELQKISLDFGFDKIFLAKKTKVWIKKTRKSLGLNSKYFAIAEIPCKVPLQGPILFFFFFFLRAWEFIKVVFELDGCTFKQGTTQITFICSMSTIKTVEKGVKFI